MFFIAWTVQMFGWVSVEAALASRIERARSTSEWESCTGRNLRATIWPSVRSWALYTTPMLPHRVSRGSYSLRSSGRPLHTPTGMQDTLFQEILNEAGGRNQTREGNQQGHPEPGQPGSPCGATCSRISSYSSTPTERARTGMTAFSDRNSPRSKMALSFASQLSHCTSSRSFASVRSRPEAGRETSPGSAYPRVRSELRHRLQVWFSWHLLL